MGAGVTLPARRLGVFALFGLNGLLYATWAARIPQIQARYEVSDGTIGLVLLTSSLGAFLSMPFAGYISERLGPVRMCVLPALLYAACVPLLAVFETPALLFATYFVIGVGFGLLDVAMNAQAVEVERGYGRAVMSSFHAGFSGSMIVGAGLSSLIIWAGVSLQTHFLLASGVALALLAFAHPRLVAAQDAPVVDDGPAFRLPARATWLIGLLGFCSMMAEASIADWTTKYMRDVVGSAGAVAPMSLLAFSAMMTVGRIFGDRLRDRYGDERLLRTGTALALVGLGFAVLYPRAWSTIAGSALVGTGLSVVVPIVFSLSGNLPGFRPSVALAMVTTISYLGLFIGPAAIGFLAENFGLRAGYGFVLAVLGVGLLLANRVRA